MRAAAAIGGPNRSVSIHIEKKSRERHAVRRVQNYVNMIRTHTKYMFYFSELNFFWTMRTK